MRVVRLEVRHFRGFGAATILPGQHVLVVGEPRAGRSDLIAALTRVLDPEATRAALEEWDFHGHDVTRAIVIEAMLGDLGDALSQRFLGELEFWDPARRVLLPGSDSVEQLAAAGAVAVLRLAYRGRWDAEEERGEHWVYYPKTSDPEADSFHRAPRADRVELPFLAPSPGRPLALSPQGQFRRLLELRGPDEIAQALRTMASGVAELSAKLSTAPAVVDSLEAVLGPVRRALDAAGPAGEVLRFLPEGGSVTGLLRALAAAAPPLGVCGGGDPAGQGRHRGPWAAGVQPGRLPGERPHRRAAAGAVGADRRRQPPGGSPLPAAHAGPAGPSGCRLVRGRRRR